MIKAIPKKKKCKRAKWLSEEALQVVEKRREVKKKKREVKGKGTPNGELQSIARRDKKAFLSNYCKDIEENSTMRKTRTLFKKTRDAKGTLHAKMGSIKDRNCMDLTEAEEIKKSWQECKEVLYRKDLNDPDNHDGVITHLEPDILEFKVKWALGSITTNKARGGDGIPVKQFQILKDDAVKVLLNIPANWENSAVVTGLEKASFLSSPKERQCQRTFTLPHNCTHLTR